MSEIQTMPKPEWKGVRNSDIWAFGTTPQLSEIQTNTTFKCYSLSTFASGLGGQDLKE